MDTKKSIITDRVVSHQTPPIPTLFNVGWDVDRFERLIQSQGYDALIERAMRCPCADKTSGQALSTCKNCGGRGWFFIDRTETRLIAQHMDSKKRYENWSEVNYGTASITTRGIDKLGFMDRIILTQLEEYFSEIIRPTLYEGSIIAYPIYEPLVITNMYLFASDTEKLVPVDSSMYTVIGNRIEFNVGIKDLIDVRTLKGNIPINISMRYSHYPVYHVVDVNRELMKVREGKFCSYDDTQLRQMPINVIARKAHFIFDSQQYGETIYDNSIVNG